MLTLWTPQFMSDVKKIGNDQWQATKVFKALLQGGVEVLSLVKGRLRENLAAAHKCLKNYKDEELEQTSLQQQEIFCLGIVRNLFTMKTKKHCNRLPRKVMESASSEILKT